jgi:hypothetical protein
MIRALALALCLAAPHAHAGDVYVWTDAEGRKQISDVVPPKYAGKARRIIVPEAAPTQERSAAAGGSAQARSEAVTLPAMPVAPSAVECQTRREIYADSRECLAFFDGLDPAVAASGRAGCPAVQPPPPTCR